MVLLLRDGGVARTRAKQYPRFVQMLVFGSVIFLRFQLSLVSRTTDYYWLSTMDAPVVQQQQQQQPSPWNHRQESSSIESNGDFQKDFLILRNVCLTKRRGQTTQQQHQQQTTSADSKPPPHEMLFFASPPSGGRTYQRPNQNTNITDHESAIMIQTYKTNFHPYTAWQSDIHRTLRGEHEVLDVSARLVYNTSMKAYTTTTTTTNTSSSSSFLMLNGTTIVAEPHSPHNMFHLYNDLILPQAYKILNPNQEANPTQNHASTTPFLRLYLTHGSKKHYDNRVIGFDVLYKVFDEVRYAVEHDLAAYPGGVCFERLFWGKVRTPYYELFGRFGTRQGQEEWKGVVPKFRDLVYDKYGIKRRQQQHQTPNTATSKRKNPIKLTWVDRPCSRKYRYISRCLRNQNEVVAQLNSSEYFTVQILSFDRRLNREEQLTKMLRLMADTDVLVGIHGAGLAHSVFLPPHSILVEVRPNEKHLFMNMASHNNIGYYAWDLFGSIENDQGTSLHIEESQVKRFIEDLHSVWKKEEHLWEMKQRWNLQQGDYSSHHENNYSTETSLELAGAAGWIDKSESGVCKKSFPRYLGEVKLSTFEQSRCYLHAVYQNDTNQWLHMQLS